MWFDDAKKISVDGTKKPDASSSVRTPGHWKGKVFYAAFDPLTG
jgi:hypothetical protein